MSFLAIIVKHEYVEASSKEHRKQHVNNTDESFFRHEKMEKFFVFSPRRLYDDITEGSWLPSLFGEADNEENQINFATTNGCAWLDVYSWFYSIL